VAAAENSPQSFDNPGFIMSALKRAKPKKNGRLSRSMTNRPDAYFVAQFSAGYTTNMLGFDLRQGQPKT
jgi:hypothetical protein